jgi:hypothetical protein
VLILPELTRLAKPVSVATCQVNPTVAVLLAILACVHKITRSFNGSPLATPYLNSDGGGKDALDPKHPANEPLIATTAVVLAALIIKSRRLLFSGISDIESISCYSLPNIPQLTS